MPFRFSLPLSPLFWRWLLRPSGQPPAIARAQAGGAVLLRRLAKFALPGWTEAESRRGAWAQKSAQRAAQARAFSGEGHSEEWSFFFGGSVTGPRKVLPPAGPSHIGRCGCTLALAAAAVEALSGGEGNGVLAVPLLAATLQWTRTKSIEFSYSNC